MMNALRSHQRAGTQIIQNRERQHHGRPFTESEPEEIQPEADEGQRCGSKEEGSGGRETGRRPEEVILSWSLLGERSGEAADPPRLPRDNFARALRLRTPPHATGLFRAIARATDTLTGYAI